MFQAVTSRLGWPSSSSSSGNLDKSDARDLQQQQQQHEDQSESIQDTEEDDDDGSVPFPLPDSQQRVKTGSGQRHAGSAPPTFNVQEPDSDNPSDLDDEDAPLPPVVIEPGALRAPTSTTKLADTRNRDRQSVGGAAASKTKPAGRNKVFVQPGFSQLDWARVQRSGKDLRGGVTQLMRITPAMMAEHKSKDDCWQAYGGKVYNVTEFLPYHPGGVPQLMRAAGRDGTELFMKAHAWVSYDRFLDGCLIGFLVRE